MKGPRSAGTLVGLLALVLALACGEAPPAEAPGSGDAPAQGAPLEEVVPAPPAPALPETAPPPANEPAKPTAAPAEPEPLVDEPVASVPEPRAVSPAPEVAPPAAPPLDLDDLERRLKQTRALGVLTKLSLKNEIDDLIDDVKDFHRNQRGDLTKLRERFDLLLLKLTSLLQDDEPSLAREIAQAREDLWRLLADPVEFAKLSA